VSLESVIAGHEGWVYSVNWSPVGLQLLSASIDKSLIIWEFDSASGGVYSLMCIHDILDCLQGSGWRKLG